MKFPRSPYQGRHLIHHFEESLSTTNLPEKDCKNIFRISSSSASSESSTSIGTKNDNNSSPFKDSTSASNANKLGYIISINHFSHCSFVFLLYQPFQSSIQFYCVHSNKSLVSIYIMFIFIGR